jgi:acetylornithine deacetylase
VLVGLDRLCAKWAESRRHEAMGAATLHVPVIAGGRHLFIYADHCVADVECRTVPGQTEAAVQQELQEVLDEVTRSVSGFQATLELLQWRPPYAIDPSRPIVRGLLECCEAVRGGAPSPAYHTWWEDSALLGEAGIEAVVLGPRGGGLHTENEWVDLASVVDLADILYRFVLRFSSGDSTQS